MIKHLHLGAMQFILPDWFPPTLDESVVFLKKMAEEARGRGYSCITSVNDSTIGILYESSQADMVFQTVSLKEIKP